MPPARDQEIDDALEAVSSGTLGPPMAARALAIVHTAMFDAWAAYDDAAVGTRLRGTLRRPPSEHTDANKGEAISYAAYRALVDLYPAQQARFEVFAQYISLRDGHTLDQDVQLFFILTNAVFDAGIAAWDAKLHYDYVRPITAIRHLKRGRKIRAWAGPGLGVRVIDGEAWRPYQPEWFPTPPFAEYVSGHSTFSAAAAEVPKRFTGSDHFGAFVSITQGDLGVEPGVPAQPVTLSSATFSAAADEAGLSRRYGGIHFEEGDLEGRRMGRAVAAVAWQTAQACIGGGSP